MASIRDHLAAVLAVLADAPRDRNGHGSLSGTALVSRSGLTPIEIEDAVKLGVGRRLLDWIETGSLEDFSFALTWITPEGRDLLSESISRSAPLGNQCGAWRSDDPNRTDELVPIGSKKSYLEDVETAVTEILASEPLALLFIDLDDFKNINETHGHERGDDVLKGIAEIISSCVRGKGKAYRWGGDEFAALLPNSTQSEAVATAERVRIGVERLDFGSANLRPTVTIGVAVGTEPSGEGFRQVFEAADAAVRTAKRNGKKNHVVGDLIDNHEI